MIKQFLRAVETWPRVAVSPLTCLSGATDTMLPPDNTPGHWWQKPRSLPNLEPRFTSPSKPDWGYTQNVLCFFYVYLCVYRVSKWADSQKDSLPLQPPSLKDQKIRQDTEHNVIRPRVNDASAFSGLNEIAAVKFNTGVSIFKSSVFGLGRTRTRRLISEPKRCSESHRRRPNQVWFPRAGKCVLGEGHGRYSRRCRFPESLREGLIHFLMNFPFVQI